MRNNQLPNNWQWQHHWQVMPCMIWYSGWEISPCQLFLANRMLENRYAEAWKACMESWYHFRASLHFIVNTLASHGPMTPYCYNQGEHSSHDENLMRGFVICIKRHHAQHPAFRYPELDDKDGQAKRSNMAQCGNQMKLVIQHQRDTSNTWCDQNGTMNVDRWWLGRRWYQADRCHPFWHGHHNILFNISSVEQRVWIMMSWKDIDAITIKGNVNPERDNIVYGVDLILIMWLSSPLCLIIPYATCCYAVQILHMTNQSFNVH